MASIYYTGKASKVAQVSRVQIGAYDASTTYSLSVNGVSVSTSGAGGVEATATALAAAWNASELAYFTPVTAAVDTGASPSNEITLTADEGGFPFTVTAGVSGGSGTIGSVTTDTEATGPHHWDNGDNWSLGRDPDDGDDIYIHKDGARICWNLDRSGASPTELWNQLDIRGDVRIGLSFAGVATSADGDTVNSDLPEYRDQYLKAAITTVEVAADSSVSVVSGSARMNIHNTDTAGSTTTIAATAQNAADTTRPAVCLLFDSANADVYVSGGRGGVGIGTGNPGETATVGDIVMDDPTDVSRMFVGDGVTHSTVRVNGGRLTLNAAATMPSITVNGGTVITGGTQAVTAATVTEPGEFISNATGTIGTLTQNGEGSVVDFHQSGKSRTVTTYNFNAGERRIDTAALTITNDNRSGRIIETIS